MKLVTFAAAGLLFSVAMAVTPVPAAAQGTPEQQAACGGDATTFCGPYLSDMQATSACMRRNFRRLTPACRAVMSSGGRKARRRHR